MNVTVKLDDLPAKARTEALRVGRKLGARVELRAADYARLSATPETLRGLGDLVAKIAQPIAAAIDAVAGTSLKTCGGCQKRREWLNKNIPL